MRIHDASLMVSYAKACINNPLIKVVSFDIFDTLLERPCLQPKDIFHLIGTRIKDESAFSDIDFCKIRLNAEEKYGIDKNPSFDDIWSWIGKTYQLGEEQIALLKEIELEAEMNLLKRREQIYEIYSYACKKHKKVIAVSDMYLSADFLQHVLKKNGYSQIQSIYVSCERKKTKREGSLYKEVYDTEGIASYNMLHVGDNIKSDFLNARKKGSIGIYIPSSFRLFCGNRKKQNEILASFNNPLNRILMGYLINRSVEKRRYTKKTMDIESFACLFFFPLIVQITFELLNKERYKDYESFFFCARDGYLPQKAYELARKLVEEKKNDKESVYLYASRMAYGCFLRLPSMML